MTDEPELPALCPRCLYGVEVLYHYLHMQLLLRGDTLTSEDLYNIFTSRIPNLLPPIIKDKTKEEIEESQRYWLDTEYARLVKKE